MIPVLWSMLHVVKSVSSTPGGALSDRLGRRPLIVGGWLVFALVYFGFSQATTAWQAWALFAGYGVYFGLTEGAEKAMIADLVGARLRGTAFGWFNLAIGLGALPASVLFGAIWTRAGSATAFLVGALLALTSAVALLFLRARAA
jgi:MFS family permease